MYVKVILDLEVKSIDKSYDYIVPSYYQKVIKVGMRVVVNFNNQNRMAYIIEILKTTNHAEKEILYLLDESPTLTKNQLKIINKIKEKSFSSYGEAFNVVVPTNLQAKYEKRFKVINEEYLVALKQKVKDGYLFLEDIEENEFKELNSLLRKGYINKDTLVKSKGSLKKIKVVSVLKNEYNSKAEEALINRLINPESYTVLIKEKYSRSLINRLIKENVLKIDYVRSDIANRNYINIKNSEIIFNKTQLNVIDKIDFNSFNKYLLTGKPASGKTVVYLELIKKIVNKNQQALILVPERSLIPLISSRVKEMFQSNFRVYDNELSLNDRLIVYDEVKNNEVNIIVGTKTALFLPFNNLKLIVLDEAHDNSYIQSFNPVYDAKEIASFSALLFKCPLLFVSATPTVEMNYQVELGQITKFELDDLRNYKPIVKLIDMRQELKSGNNSMFSAELKARLDKNISAKEQSIILVNKKGYAPFVMCRSCGIVESCPYCERSLTYFKNKNMLICSSCGYKKVYSKTCSTCNSNAVRPVGFGIEQVYEEMLKEFPMAKIAVLNHESTTKKGMVNKVLNDFNEQKYDILLGTQMVSKGHHYENVSLVAVLLADQMLNLSSFLANEKTYQLLTQHIGRLRGVIKGTALIQVYDTNNLVLKAIKENNYELFYQNEIKLRKKLKYPPFYNIVKVILMGKNQRKTYQNLYFLKANILKQNTQIEIIGPNEDYSMYKNGNYYYELIIKAPKRYDIMSLLTYISKRFKDERYQINMYDDSL